MKKQMLTPYIDLPVDRPMAGRQKFGTSVVSETLAKTVREDLQFVSKRKRIPASVLFVAVYQMLIYRYTGRRDLTVGVNLDGKHRKLQCHLSGETTVAELFERVAHAVQDAAEQGEERLPIMFAWQQSTARDQQASPPSPELMQLTTDQQPELALLVDEREAEIELIWVYRSELFDRQTIERMSGHFQQLLTNSCRPGARQMGDLPMLRADERKQLLEVWSGMSLSCEADLAQVDPQAAHQMFEAAVAQRPEQVAVEFAGESLTYAELNDRANQTARFLQRFGVGPDVLVGICIERSLEMIVAMIGVWKAGGAYVPLDPAYPIERLRYMLDDSKAQVLLTQEHLLERLPNHASTICWERRWADIERESGANLPVQTSGDSLAYVIYTSGSTGRPKGVMLTHRGLCNTIRTTVKSFQISADSRVLQFASFSFDAATNEISNALAAGGTLVLARRESLLPGPELIALLRDQQITNVTLPPSVLSLLPDEFPHLHTVVSAGESCSIELAARWSRGRTFVNGYGPTEATICASTATYREGCARVTIGRPLDNVQLYVLDERMHPVPIGLPGELYIGGAGVARGYLHRERLTEERFVPDPFAKQAGRRLYRTGDLARWRSDGNVEFLGRIDHQVKLRGFRIELGEIEQVLLLQESVREAVLIADEDEAGVQKLIAYVGVHEGAECLKASDLRQFLCEHLPEFMVPSAFVLLDRLPLTANGKVDRQALPAPSEIHLLRGADHVAPRTPLEESLVSIWQNVMKVSAVGIDDSFFDLGGHSLMAVQILARVQEQIGVDISIQQLFAFPTVAQLAGELERLQSEGKLRSAESIGKAPRAEALPVSFAQERVWFVHKMNPDNLAYAAQAVIRFRGTLDHAALEHALTAMVERHEMFRTSFQEIDGHPVQQIHQPFAVQVPLVSLLTAAEPEREGHLERLMGAEMRRPFTITQLPLVRWVLYQVRSDEHILLQIEHHFVHDGWSFNVFLREFAELYTAYVQGQPSRLAEMTIQFADFANWQRKWLESEQAAEQLSYWKQKLSGCQPVLELPSDRPRPATPSYRGGAVRVELEAELCAQITEIGKREGATLYLTLLAAFYLLLYRYTGQTDMLVGSAVANRRLRDTEGLIGMIVNNVVLRAELTGEMTFHRLLKLVRTTAVEAFSHEDLPFDKVVEAINPVREMSRNPLLQVMFSFHDSAMPALDLPDLDVQVREALNNGSAKFDLNVVGVPHQQGRIGDGEGNGLTLIWEYSSDLFDEETIRRMVVHYQTLLASIIERPDQLLDRVNMLPAAEEERLLTVWHDGGRVEAADACLHRLFEEQADRSPDAIAVVCREEEVTYRELNRRANRLAHRLRALGVKREERVGICVDRSLLMIVGLLGILKAGGAYLPLDPDYPQERLTFMTTDAQVSILLTAGNGSHLFPSWPGRIVQLDGEDHTTAEASEENLGLAMSSGQLAYLIYTSGSTGRPKGVEIEHRNLVNFLASMQREPGLSAQDTLLAVTSLSFDIAALELFLPLVNGAKVVLADRDAVTSGARLVELIERTNVTIMQATPVTWRLLLDAGWQNQRRVKMLCGGEALPYDLAERLTATGAELWNLYGPTETTIWSTCCRVEAQCAGSPPIGRPIRGTQAFVLDEQMRPMPIGVSGELYIGGSGVARGYHERTELTAERFVPHPFQADGGRLYKTGDRARFLADGNLQYLGRLDQQIKLRGLRIELEEIEAQLHQNERVLRAAVAVKGESEQSARLIGYVVPRAGTMVSPSELRDDLLAKLPDYMVPTTFCFLDELPLTPNGKLDRRALPEPDDRSTAQLKDQAPRDNLELQIARIVAEQLGREQIGVFDNFFELGGHSLLAIRVASRLQTAFGVEVPFRALFAEQTVARLSGLVRKLGQAQGMRSLPPIAAVPRDAELPLSVAQERLWILDQLLAGSAAYNFPVAWQIKGTLNRDALAQSLAELVRRHEALRTVFVEREDRVQQVILDPRPDLLDFRSAGAEELIEAVQAEAQRPFLLSKGPLFRFTLWQVENDEHVLLLNLHHIITDGWSYGVLAKELAALYASFAQQKLPQLPALPVQYADFAIAQRGWLQGEMIEQQISYWRDQLAGELPLLRLPLDHARPAVQTYRGSFCMRSLPSTLTANLRKVGQQNGATLYMTLLAAYLTLLYRYTGQEDLLVGSPIAGRNRPEVEGMIGFFVNTLVMRTDLAGDPTFAQLLHRVRETALSAFEHQDVPFERLVEEMQPERSSSHSPLFQTTFQLLSTWELELADLVVSRLDVQTETAKYDLSVAMIEADGELIGRFDFNTDLFEAETIERMIDHFLILLQGIAEQPARHLSELPVISAAEKRRVLVEWNRTETAYPRHLCVHQLFEEQAAFAPDAVALISEGRSITYGELDRRANRLAHHLKRRGVVPDRLVGICVERSFEMIVCLLGILKAGGAYLPLDPDYPQERLSLMVADASISLLLTQHHLADRLSELQVELFCLDSEWAQLEQESMTPPPTVTTPDHLAYVIYTSGSTGRPKGVAVPHRAVVRLVKGTDYVNFSADEVFLQNASISFDAATFEIWGSLLNGARLVLSPPGRMSLQELGHLLIEQKVTTLWLTAGLFHQMVEMQLPQLRQLRQLLAGGDVLSLSHVQTVFKRLPSLKLINGYGPTENTTFTCCETISERSLLGATVSIGRPIANSQVYVLDRNLQPVPIGVSGELYIGGAGLARGYLNRPELTAEKFIEHPFSDRPDAKLYKTGDLVRYLPDGRIEFLGRSDQQVKIRGFRVEIGEVEAKLRACRSVSEAVVTVREFEEGEKRLVAYVVPLAQERFEERKVRKELKKALPDYMMPYAIIPLTTLPLTQNGKVDLRALPELEPRSSQLSIAPRNREEEWVVKQYAELLHRSEVGIYDNFFELGGHSLLATRAISRIRAAFGVDLSLQEFFAESTAAEVVRQIADRRSERAGTDELQLLSVLRAGSLPLSFAQRRLWFLEQYEPGEAVYNIPIALSIAGKLDRLALERSLQEIVRRHEALRTIFVQELGEPAQLILPAEELVLTVTPRSLEHLATEERADMLMRTLQDESCRAFHLQQGPLVRALLIRLAEQEHVLQLNMHHIVSDGWSIGVIASELSALYRAYSLGHSSPVDELAIQYADYAVWQQNWLQGDRLAKQLSYWQGRLGGKLPILQLPADRPRPSRRTYRGAVHRRELSVALSRKIRTFCSEEGSTLFMTLLTAYKALLSRYTGLEDILVGSPIAGRNRAEIEGLVGFFVNTLVLRTDLAGQPSFRELLERVRESALSAFDHADLPFERLVDELQPERHVSLSPLFQVMFAMQNAADERWELQNLTVQPMRVDQRTSKFDLTLTVAEEGELLRIHLEYNTDLFDRETIERLCEHYVNLVAAGVAEPMRPIDQLPLLSEQERHQLLFAWNQTDVPIPDRCLHQLFEEQVDRTPHGVAAIFGDQELSYAELERRANQLAHHLRSLGVGPDVPVGICMERSLELVVGLVAILKAGGAFLPLDTEAPPARVAQVLNDAGVNVCLTQSALRAKLPAEVVTSIELDGGRGAFDLYPTSRPEMVIRPEHLISIYYTSGSTGRPKGVCSTQRGWVNRMVWMQKRYRLQPGETVLQKTTLTFDDAACEIFWPLIVGGRIALLEPELHKDPRAIIDAAICYQAVFLTFVPSMLTLFVDCVTEEDRAGLSQLRHVGSSGEALRSDLVRSLREKVGCRLHNTWGATEASIDSTIHTCTADDEQSAEIVSIGQPIDNNRCYVLDSHMQPVPIGVAGDLYLGGLGLATGYLGDPERTAESFLPNPFVPGERLYKTGDRGAFRRDGSLLFFGRRDDQVKVRGQRVELGEVEAVLAGHPALQQAVVTSFKRADGDQLVAYYLLPPEAEQVSNEQLRAYLSERLPSYMVPWRFVKLEQLPLTVSGKVDRKQLPDPGEERPELEAAFLAPSGRSELAIAAIWQEILGVEQVGARDNFFDLGGHSLSATRIVSRINRELGLSLPLRNLFESPTIAELAASIETFDSTASQTTKQSAISRDPDRRVFPLSHAQQRYWFQYQFDQANSSLGVINLHLLDGALDETIFMSAYRELTVRHSIMRTTLAERAGGDVVQIVHQSPMETIRLVDLAPLAVHERADLLLKDLQQEQGRAFDLLTDTFFRARLYKLADDRHVFLCNIHPIAYDGWSITIFLSDLAALYRALRAGEDSSALAPAVQYGEYAVWQHERLATGDWEDQKLYWRQNLQREISAPALPYDFIEPAPRPEHMTIRQTDLSQNLLGQLRALAAEQGTTLYLSLLAGLKIWLSLLAGQNVITICSPNAGRNHPDLESILGLMVNPLVMRTDLSDNPTGRQVVERVKETAYGAYANQDYPFDLILKELRAERDGSEAEDLYNVVFVGQNAHLEATELVPGVTIRFITREQLQKELKLDHERRTAESDLLAAGFADDPSVAFDLHIEAFEQGDRLCLVTSYNTKRFTAETVDQLLAEYEQVLLQFSANADLRLSQINLTELDELF